MPFDVAVGLGRSARDDIDDARHLTLISAPLLARAGRQPARRFFAREEARARRDYRACARAPRCCHEPLRQSRHAIDPTPASRRLAARKIIALPFFTFAHIADAKASRRHLRHSACERPAPCGVLFARCHFSLLADAGAARSIVPDDRKWLSRHDRVKPRQMV